MKRRAVLGCAGAALLAGAGAAWYREKKRTPTFWEQAFVQPDGSNLALQQFQNRPLILNFWATWCPPCIAELPLLERFYQQHHNKSWQMMGLAVDQVDAVKSFLQRMHLTFPIAVTGLSGLHLSQTLGNPGSGLPFTVALDAKGDVFYRKIGPLFETDLQALLPAII